MSLLLAILRQDLLVKDLNTRITRSLREHRLHLGETVRVLEEHNVTFILNKLAFLEDAVDFCPASGATVELEAPSGEHLLEGCTGLPGIVVGDLARDVVEDVGLGDAVGGVCTEPAPQGAEVA